MSADNWTTCYNCKQVLKSNIDKARDHYDETIRTAYGTVDSDEYERLRAEAQALVDDAIKKHENQEHTFREDYEFYGAETGEVTASYSGRCTVCDYGIYFVETHPIPDIQRVGKR